jgi:hypothetical protein
MAENRVTRFRDEASHLGQQINSHRIQTQNTAQELTVLALRQWEKAAAGLFALPAAAALGAAATVLHAASVFERAFELFEGSVVEVGRRIDFEVDTLDRDRSEALRARDGIERQREIEARS